MTSPPWVQWAICWLGRPVWLRGPSAGAGCSHGRIEKYLATPEVGVAEADGFQAIVVRRYGGRYACVFDPGSPEGRLTECAAVCLACGLPEVGGRGEDGAALCPVAHTLVLAGKGAASRGEKRLPAALLAQLRVGAVAAALRRGRSRASQRPRPPTPRRPTGTSNGSSLTSQGRFADAPTLKEPKPVTAAKRGTGCASAAPQRFNRLNRGTRRVRSPKGGVEGGHG